jgi:hypothetical protein
MQRVRLAFLERTAQQLPRLQASFSSRLLCAVMPSGNIAWGQPAYGSAMLYTRCKITQREGIIWLPASATLWQRQVLLDVGYGLEISSWFVASSSPKPCHTGDEPLACIDTTLKAGRDMSLASLVYGGAGKTSQRFVSSLR